VKSESFFNCFLLARFFRHRPLHPAAKVRIRLTAGRGKEGGAGRIRTPEGSLLRRLLLLAALVVEPSAWAAETPARRARVSLTPPPVVLVIRSATTSDGQKHERRLFDELGLALDGFMVLSQDAARPGFATLSLADQIASVLPEARLNGALVVVWMSFPVAHQIMLHVVALGSGRTLVRSIEGDRSPVSESSLALIVRELLGTAFLFDAPEAIPAEVTEVVRSVKRQIPADVVTQPAEPPEAGAWSLWTRAQMGYPLAGGEDEVPVLDLGAAVERRLPLDIDASLGLDLGFADVSRPNASGARFLTLGPKLAAYRGFPAAALTWGPWAAASVSYGAFRIPGQIQSFALPKLELGGQIRSAAAAPAGVALTAGLALNANREELLGSDGQPLYRTPAVELVFALAVGWSGL
jgi:hypothetical protein